jgi:hypothetical protein
MQINEINRRAFLKNGFWGFCLAGFAFIAAFFGIKKRKPNTVWQLDPHICTSCGNCATYCVLEESAVKCVHAHAMWPDRCNKANFCRRPLL